MLKDYGDVTDVQRSKIKVVCNFHTHNYLCGHAGGSVSDYVKRAVDYGYESIGISDHCIPPVGSYEPYFSLSNIDDEYLPQFERARARYGDKIKIYSGAEIEYFDGHDDYYRELLKKLDYLVLGQHEFMNGIRRKNSFVDGDSESNFAAYCDSVKRAIKSGFFSVLAHPDLIFYRRLVPTESIKQSFSEMIGVAANAGVPVELNANGIRNHGFRYPTDLLVDCCQKHNAKVVISSDAHSPQELLDDCVTGMYVYAQAHGLNVVTEIPFFGE